MDIYILVALVVMLFAILGTVLWLWHSDRKENRKNFAILNEKLSRLDESAEKGLGVLAEHGERLSRLDESAEKGLGVLAEHGERLSSLDESAEKGLGVLAEHGERLSSLDESIKETLTMLGNIDSSMSRIKVPQKGELTPDQILSADSDDSLQFRMPGVWVDRKQFLRSQLGPYDYTYNNQLLTDILRDGPPQAGINLDEIDQLADDCIADFLRKVYRVSSGSRSPDSYTIDKKDHEAAQVIDNLTKVFVHKLAHLYGIYDLLNGKGVDQSTQDEISQRISELLRLFVADENSDWLEKGEDWLERNADQVVKSVKKWSRNIFQSLLKKTSHSSLVKKFSKSLVPVSRGTVATTSSPIVAEIGTSIISHGIKFIIGQVKKGRIRKRARRLKDLFREIAVENFG